MQIKNQANGNSQRPTVKSVYNDVSNNLWCGQLDVGDLTHPNRTIYTAKSKSAPKSVFLFEFRVGVWRNRFVRAWRMQHRWAHNLKKNYENFFYDPVKSLWYFKGLMFSPTHQFGRYREHTFFLSRWIFVNEQ